MATEVGDSHVKHLHPPATAGESRNQAEAAFSLFEAGTRCLHVLKIYLVRPLLQYLEQERTYQYRYRWYFLLYSVSVKQRSDFGRDCGRRQPAIASSTGMSYVRQEQTKTNSKTTDLFSPPINPSITQSLHFMVQASYI